MRLRYVLAGVAIVGLLAPLDLAARAAGASFAEGGAVAAVAFLCGVTLVSCIDSLRRWPANTPVDGFRLTERGWSRRRYAHGTALGATIHKIRYGPLRTSQQDSPGRRPTRLRP